MNRLSTFLLATVALTSAATAAAQVTLYEREDFGGRALTATGPVANFRRADFNDAASSAVVRGERWEVCEDSNYGGRCVLLRRGEYPSLRAMGLNDRLSSRQDFWNQSQQDRQDFLNNRREDWQNWAND